MDVESARRELERDEKTRWEQFALAREARRSGYICVLYRGKL